MHRQWIRGIQLGFGLGVVGLAFAGLLKSLGLVVGGYLAVFFGTHLEKIWNRPILRVPAVAGAWPLRRKDLRRMTWSRQGTYDVLRGAGGGPSWAGPDAVVPLMLVLPYFNRDGASRKQRARAIAILESVGDPVDLVLHPRPDWVGRVRDIPHEARLAREMAANEQAERDAIEGRLEALRDAWKEAEETAAIADSLLIPRWVDDLIRRWKSDPPVTVGAGQVKQPRRD